MKTYRIVKHSNGKHQYWEIQRKSILGFWYNPDNTDAYTTGSYDSLKEAQEMLDLKLRQWNTTVEES